MFRAERKHPSCCLITSDLSQQSLVLQCNSYNQTFSSFTVDCTTTTTSLQAGVQFQFVIENSQLMSVIRNISTSSPRLTLSDLPASTDFLVKVSSSQAGVRSQPVIFHTFTTREGEKPLATMPEQTGGNSPAGLLSLLATFLLISLVLVLIIIAVVATVRNRLRQPRNSPSSQPEHLIEKRSTDPDFSPDIIPKESGERMEVVEVVEVLMIMSFISVCVVYVSTVT